MVSKEKNVDVFSISLAIISYFLLKQFDMIFHIVISWGGFGFF